jgi:hypothetical protein
MIARMTWASLYGIGEREADRREHALNRGLTCREALVATRAHVLLAACAKRHRRARKARPACRETGDNAREEPDKVRQMGSEARENPVDRSVG